MYEPISILSDLRISILLILLSFKNSRKLSSISYPASKYILPVFSSIISEDIKKPINDSSFIVTLEMFFFFKSLIIFWLTFVPLETIILPFLEDLCGIGSLEVHLQNELDGELSDQYRQFHPSHR